MNLSPSSSSHLTSTLPLEPAALCPDPLLLALARRILKAAASGLSKASSVSDGFQFQSFQSVLTSASVIALTVFVHESGHFLAASLQGIRLRKFAVGVGPLLAKFTANNVEYSFRSLPLGGLVQFSDAGDLDRGIPADDVADLLNNRPVLDRIIVISVGLIANVLFAYIVVLIQAVSVGLPVREPSVGIKILEVAPGSSAERFGLRSGDLILRVDRLSSPSASDITEAVKRRSPSKSSLAFGVERDENSAVVVLVVNVVPDTSSDGRGRSEPSFLHLVTRYLFYLFLLS